MKMEQENNFNQKEEDYDDDDDIDDGFNNQDDDIDLNESLDRFINETSMDELPKSLIITNMDSRIFQQGSEQRAEFEMAFRQLDSDVKFLYFKSFRRARLDFSNQQVATKARILMNQIKFGDEQINCYFAEISTNDNGDTVDTNTKNLLKPPALQKQFLISPPASPPEGWEPIEEAQPTIMNIDLQSALANLLPGQTHELHHPSSCNQPSIVVHVCSDSINNQKLMDNDDGFYNDDIATIQNNNSNTKMKIQQTPCPPRH